MRRILVFIAFVSFVAVSAFAAESVNQCNMNCPPGNNPCVQCCMAQFDAASQPCMNSCRDNAFPCFQQALNNCNNDTYSECYRQASAPCIQAEYSCQQQCENTVQIAGGCPDEVPPQTCPFDCQSWNSASRSCVGAPMNGCSGGSTPPQPPPQKCPFDCQSWNPASNSCVGAPMNGCALHALRAEALRRGLVKPAKATAPPPPPKKQEEKKKE